MNHNYIPINARQIKFGTMKQEDDRWPLNLVEQINDGRIKVPKTLVGLDTTRKFFKHMNAQEAATLGFAPVSGSTKSSKDYFIQLFAQYKEIRKGSQLVLYGIGVFWVVEIIKQTRRAKLGGMSGIAASAELGFLNASVDFQVRGASSPAISAAMPKAIQLTVDKYVELVKSLEKIQALIPDSGTKITPQILAFPDIC